MSERPTVHVWITKYALTQGVYEADARICETSPRMIAVGRYDIYHKPDWHETKEAAQCRVKDMIAARFKSLETSRAKLEGLSVKCESQFDSMVKVMGGKS